jgi:DNA-binding response OmpR family regulator
MKANDLLMEQTHGSRPPREGTAREWRSAPDDTSRRLTATATKRILLADDDPGVREMVGRVLESEHYVVTFARNGREAAQRFSASAPDLVLLDLNMPDGDGWKTFGQMCHEDPLVPVIVITARPHQLTNAVELGVDALMEKPLNLPLLLETIRNLMAETEAERTQRLTNPEFKTVLLRPADSPRQPQPVT